MTGFALGLDRFVTSGIFFWSPHFSRLRVLTKGLTEGWWDSLDTVWTGWTRWDQCSASERQFAVATNINWYWQAPLCCSIRFNWWWSFKHNQHTYHRLPDGILFLWEQNLGIRYVLCQEAVTNYPPQLWPLCNWLVKMSRKFLQNTKVPHCWYFSDTRFISFVTLMGLLTIKNHFCTTFSGTDFTISCWREYVEMVELAGNYNNFKSR